MAAGVLVGVGMAVYQLPLWISVIIGLIVMTIFNIGLERVVLRPMIGRPIIAIIMATIGLSAILQGFVPMVFGGEPQPIALPISEDPIEWGPIFVAPVEVAGALMSVAFLAVFALFFMKSRKGVAMRAVADNHQVSMAMGINVERYFALAWVMAGVVAVLGGVIWGNLLGADTQLALIGLKVFPVVILGGLDSIVGVIVAGLIIGVIESLSAGFLDPFVGGGTKNFVPYVIMILVLMVRPYGLFGTPVIERI
jgi:branched-chain amino acid transport system permease protein